MSSIFKNKHVMTASLVASANRSLYFGDMTMEITLSEPTGDP
jgi:hypothetical protein